MKRFAAPLLCLLVAAPLGAHPHIFVETGIDAIVDDIGHLTHVRVTWVYDEFYSLLITEDRALDPDYDGVLTPEELAQLNGFDMQWVDGFNGDLVVTDGARDVPLSGPQDIITRFSEGRITTVHTRAVTGSPQLADGVVIKPYDPTYYTAYEVNRPVKITGNDGCRGRVKMPDMTAGLKAVQEQLSTLDMESDPEDVGLPDIGAALANEVILSCAVP
tara:strand:- start:140077 stop:140727 length:651 start_codon:yes stop_codon:yes gene_type:complete